MGGQLAQTVLQLRKPYLIKTVGLIAEAYLRKDFLNKDLALYSAFLKKKNSLKLISPHSVKVSFHRDF